MRIGGIISFELSGEGFIISFSLLAKHSHTLVGKNVLDAKGKVIGRVTKVYVDKPNKEVYWWAEITKKLPKGECIVSIQGEVKDFSMSKLKLMGVK